MGPKASLLLGLVWHNKGVKLLSLILAWASWTLIQDVISYEVKITEIPVVVRVDQPGWAVLDMSPQSVNVVFRGPQEQIWEMDRNRVKVEIEMREVEARDSTLMSLESRHVRAPRGLRVVNIDPPQVYFSLGQIAETNVPVKATTTGELPAGFEVEDIVYRPATVTLHGPQQRLASVQTIRTAPIDLGGRVRSFERRVPLVVPNEGWGARVDPGDVLVQFTIVERSATRDVPNVEIRALVGALPPASISVKPARADVVLEGGTEALDLFDDSSLLLYVNCSGLSPGATYELPVQASLPPGLRVKTIEPAIVEVKL